MSNNSPEEYPKYDNCDAIEVSKLSQGPCDYAGVTGVPITFCTKYNPDQFEIIGLAGSRSPIYLNGKQLFNRVLIKNNQPLI